MRIEDFDSIPASEESELLENFFSKEELLNYARKIHLAATFALLRTKPRIAKVLLLYAKSDVTAEMLSEARARQTAGQRPHKRESRRKKRVRTLSQEEELPDLRDDIAYSR